KSKSNKSNAGSPSLKRQPSTGDQYQKNSPIEGPIGGTRSTTSLRLKAVKTSPASPNLRPKSEKSAEKERESDRKGKSTEHEYKNRGTQRVSSPSYSYDMGSGKSEDAMEPLQLSTPVSLNTATPPAPGFSNGRKVSTEPLGIFHRSASYNDRDRDRDKMGSPSRDKDGDKNRNRDRYRDKDRETLRERGTGTGGGSKVRVLTNMSIS
ncbi:hypothetical protein SARC_16629, partial [Sphaeroforma arctica JP610]